MRDLVIPLVLSLSAGCAEPGLWLAVDDPYDGATLPAGTDLAPTGRLAAGGCDSVALTAVLDGVPMSAAWLELDSTDGALWHAAEPQVVEPGAHTLRVTATSTNCSTDAVLIAFNVATDTASVE